MTMSYGSPFSFSDIIEEDPRMAFFSVQNRFGQSPAQKKFFQSQFQPIFNQYLGTLGASLKRGELPTQTFGEFTEQFPFTQRFSSMPPSMRPGAGRRQFAPPTQFFF